MFKKVVSQVTFSPATVQQLAQYASATRQRQRLHGWAITALAILVVTSSVVALLPHHSNTTPSANDLIPGGLSSSHDILSAYDADINHLQSAVQVLGIDRQDLASATHACDTDSQPMRYITGNLPYNTPGQHAYERASAPPLYLRPFDTSNRAYGWCGTSDTGDSFMLSAVDGNILTTAAPDADEPELVRSHTVDTTTLSTGHLATWTLELSNPTDQLLTEDIWFASGDITEYAHIISVSDRGISSENTHHILWPRIVIEPNETRTLTVTAQLIEPVDQTAQQLHNLHAYDCTVTTSFGNTTDTAVDCPIVKQAESLLHTLPPTDRLVGPLVFTGLFMANLLIYLSLRLQTKELRIIRRQLNTGGL